MLEKDKLNFEDLISVVNKNREKNNSNSQNPMYKLLNNINAENLNKNVKTECIKKILDSFMKNKSSLLPSIKESFYIYALLLLVFVVFIGVLLMFALLGIHPLLRSVLENIFVSGVILILTTAITYKVSSIANKKLYSFLFDELNKEVMNNFKDEINNVFSNSENKIYFAEYLFYLNKFEGGLENRKNILLLTYLVNKYGLEEKDISECIVSEQRGVPLIRDIKSGIMKVKMSWFKYKTNKKVNWENIYKEIDIFVNDKEKKSD